MNLLYRYDQGAASRNYIASMLQQRQYTVIMAKSGREGLVNVRKELPAAIIFKPILPDMYCVELVNRFRQYH